MGGEAVHIGGIIYMTIAVSLAVLYNRISPIVILPSLMIASLIGKAFGVAPPLIIASLSPFALALLVFTAGIELDTDFFKKEKERLLFFIFVEASIILTLYGILRTVWSWEMALTLTAIMIASNEAFAYELGKKIDKTLANYGIAISIMEDSLAILLASIGYFTSLKVSQEVLVAVTAWSLLSIIVSYFISIWIDRMIKRARELSTKVLITLLYLLILISMSELMHMPEALIVFIGAIAIAFRGFDKETLKVIESFMILALMGFVMSLPYEVTLKGAPTLFDVGVIYFKAVLLGFILAILAFIIRFAALFSAFFLSGIEFMRGLRLSVALANTGEFGLVVLATLLAGGLELPPEVALGAMFAYAFNLTILNLLVNRIGPIIAWMTQGPTAEIMEKVREAHKEVKLIVDGLFSDVNFKRHIYELIFLGTMTYFLTGLFYRVAENPLLSQVVVVLMTSALFSSLFVVFNRISQDLLRAGAGFSYNKAFSSILRILIIYVILLPLIGLVSDLIRRSIKVTFSNPLIFLLIVFFSVFFVKMADSFINMLSKGVPGEIPGVGQPDSG